MRRSLALLLISVVLIAAGAIIWTISESSVGVWLSLAGMLLFAVIALVKTFGLSLFSNDLNDDLDL